MPKLDSRGYAGTISLPDDIRDLGVELTWTDQVAHERRGAGTILLLDMYYRLSNYIKAQGVTTIEISKESGSSMLLQEL